MLTIEANCIVELDHFNSLKIACKIPPYYDINRHFVVDLGRPLIEDNFSTMDKRVGPNMSFIQGSTVYICEIQMSIFF